MVFCEGGKNMREKNYITMWETSFRMFILLLVTATGYARLENDPIVNLEPNLVGCSEEDTCEKSRLTGNREALLRNLLKTIKGESKGTKIRAEEGFIAYIATPPKLRFMVTDVNEKDQEEKPDAFVRQWKELFAEGHRDMKYSRVGSSHTQAVRARNVYYYKQEFMGIPVWKGQIVICADANDNITSVRAPLLREVGPFTADANFLMARISSGEARTYAMSWMKQKAPDKQLVTTTPELVIFVPEIVQKKGKDRLAWYLVVKNKNALVPSQEVFVDAENGKVLYNIAYQFVH